MAVAELRQRFQSDSKEVVIPMKIDVEIPDVKITVPKRGEKKDLLKLSDECPVLHARQTEAHGNGGSENFTRKLLSQVQEDLRLPNLPRGSSALTTPIFKAVIPWRPVWFSRTENRPKSEYRHFNVKSVEGPDDFASMTEIVYRRYKRMLDEGKDLPQLIVIDGGKDS